MKKAKIKAVQEGITLKKLLIKSLEKELSESEDRQQDVLWKSLRGQGSAGALRPEDSGFENYSGPEWLHTSQVNDPDK